MSYYSGRNSHIRNKVKVVSDLTNYDNKKNYNMLQEMIQLI